MAGRVFKKEGRCPAARMVFRAAVGMVGQSSREGEKVARLG
jgi:hypothetical protein